MAKKRTFAVGVDYGTNSVRALVVDTADGREVATSVFPYPSGEAGILLDPKDPNLARQNPADYIEGFYQVGQRRRCGRPAAIAAFGVENVVGIGVDTTGSTPLPVDRRGHAAGHEAGVPQEPGRPRLAVEGPHQHRRGGRDHREGRQASRRLSGQVRRHLQQRVVLVEDPALQADGPEGLRGGLLPGSNWPTSCPASSPATSIPSTMPRGICAAGHKAMYQRAVGRPAEEGVPDAASIPTWPCLAETLRHAGLAVRSAWPDF